MSAIPFCEMRRIKAFLHLREAHKDNLILMTQHFKILCDILADELEESPTSDRIREFKEEAVKSTKSEITSISKYLKNYIRSFIHGKEFDDVISLFVDMKKEKLWETDHINHALGNKIVNFQGTYQKVKEIILKIEELLEL